MRDCHALVRGVLAATYSAIKQSFATNTPCPSTHVTTLRSSSAGRRISGRVTFAEHDAVACSVSKKFTFCSRCSAKLMLKNCSTVCANPGVELMADKHRVQCVSLRQRASPLHESTPPDVVVVVDVDVDEACVDVERELTLSPSRPSAKVTKFIVVANVNTST